MSFTLSGYAMVIPCDPVAPPGWNIDGHWYCATPMVEPFRALKELEAKTMEFKDKDFITGLDGNIYSNMQIRQHWLVQRIYNSREAQAIMGFYYANEGGNVGPDSIWCFRTGLSGDTIVQLEQSVLSQVSFLIPAIGSAWPWIVGIGLILAIVQTLAGCIAMVYLVYQAQGIGLWLIPAALGMAFTLLAIPCTAIRAIWKNLKQGLIMDIEQETMQEREQALRGPGPRLRKTRLYLGLSWDDEIDEEADTNFEPPSKKAVIGIPLKDVSRLIRASAPQINSTFGWGKPLAGDVKQTDLSRLYVVCVEEPKLLCGQRRCNRGVSRGCSC